MKRFANKILSLFCRPEYYNDIRGDLEELYTRRIKSSTKLYAGIKYFLAVLMLMRPSLMKPIKLLTSLTNGSMINQYFKASVRSFSKHKTYSTINVFGLSVGIAASILLYSYVSFEMSFDKSYENKDRIYRVTNHSKRGDRIRGGITGSGMLAPALNKEIPEIELAGRRHYFGRPVIQIGDTKFRQTQCYYADPNLTTILEYDYLFGDEKKALEAPNSVVISKATARKMFENETKALGKTMLVNQVFMQVTGVIEDVAANSNFVPHMLVSMSTMSKIGWNWMGHITYVLLEDNVPSDVVNDKMAMMVDRLSLGDPEEGISVWYDLYPISEIHLSTDDNQEGRGNRSMIYALSLIAVFILLIASINYMNLATARSSQRAKEIGVKKVIGALRRQISFQFLAESLFVSFISVVIGGLLALFLESSFITMTGIPSSINFFSVDVILKLAGLGLAIGLVSGSYPAIILSSFKPATILKGGHSSVGSQGLRRVLVSFQFVISIILIVSTIVIFNQINFLQNKDLGFSQEAIYVVRLGKPDSEGVLKQTFLQNPHIKNVASSNLMPATGDSGATFSIRDEDGEASEDIVSMATIDDDYLDLMEIELLSGKAFAADNGTNTGSIIVNEAMVKKYGWKEPLGQSISIGGNEEGDPMENFVIEGVVKDFNMLSLYSPIKPFAFFKKPKFNWGAQYLLLKLDDRDLMETISFIQNEFESFDQGSLFSGRFLDDHLESIYQNEKKTANVFLVFALLTITIACLGLFGLATYSLERRTREISIRKVLGAKLGDIVKLVSVEFVLIIMVSSLIAAPCAYFAMKKWLGKFSYHIDISVFTMLTGSLAVLVIALMTISIQAIRTAKSNPACTLKCE